jgi:hypothetical protein
MLSTCFTLPYIYVSCGCVTCGWFGSSAVERGIADPKVTGSTPVQALFHQYQVVTY